MKTCAFCHEDFRVNFIGSVHIYNVCDNCLNAEAELMAEVNQYEASTNFFGLAPVPVDEQIGKFPIAQEVDETLWFM